ncbi:conserved hypothetical protein [Trichophyton verrucosum HKI 0517]|uniref:Uncharacterized protein n=1 Tax=Trichophyton verrucosum (strain HKI 0517) TaxID=663202 RepID=D4D8C8_TRIVH|nr:uncharacterized protein TRV_03364 [Trichophyton verrucosum HKI 0517]EFE41904.1 conserved hypothetical protein [Trichophyton verrucosum HKI 0517]
MRSGHINSRSKPPPPQIPINLRWCNRALRPLTSIYVRLEKHWKISPLRDEEYIQRAYGGCESSFNSSQNGRRSMSGSGNASDSESAKEDPTWVPGDAVRKPIKHRYSGRKERSRTNFRSKVVVRSPETEKLQPGQLAIATPLILGKRRMVSFPKMSTSVDSTENEMPQAQKMFSYSKRKYLGTSWSLSEIAHGIEDTYNDPSYVAIVQTIFSAWDTFLRMSDPQQSKPHRGANSLLSMALSTTSKYILQEQERVNSLEEKDEETDVAGCIITELEKMYAMGDNGWRPLKELVRSHGIHLMCEAIRRRWLSPQLSRRIVLQSFSLQAHDAASALLSAMLSISPVIPPPIRLDSNLFKSSHSVALHTLESYVRPSGGFSIFFREMASLLDRGRLPAEWIATDSMKYYLTAALQSLAADDEHSFASLRLITSSILAAAGSKRTIPPQVLSNLRRSKRGAIRVRKSESEAGFTSSFLNPKASCYDPISIALSNSITSILTVLSSSHFAKSGFGKAVASTMYNLLSYVSTIVQRDIERTIFDKGKNKLNLQPTRACAILLSDFLANFLGNSRKESQRQSAICASPILHNLGYLTAMHTNKKELVEELADFILQIARCLGRVQNDNGFEVAKRFTLAFNTSSVKKHPILRIVLSKVAVEVALKFAESTCLQEHHDWASYIQDQVAACDFSEGDMDELQPLTPSLRRTETGFRWEDGIGEWVAKSPILSRARSSKSTPPLPDSTASTSQRGMTDLKMEISDTEESSSGFSMTSNQNGDNSSVSSEYSDSPPPKRKRLAGSFGDQSSIRVSERGQNNTYFPQRQAARHWSPSIDSQSDNESRHCRRVARKLVSPTTTGHQRSTGGTRMHWRNGNSDNVAVVIEVPRKRKPNDLGAMSLKEHVVCRRKRRATEPFGSKSSAFTPTDKEEENEEDEEEEDILNHAPALSQRFQHRIQTASSQTQTRLKKFRSARPRRSARLSLAERVIPCSDSSEDELSFC